MKRKINDLLHEAGTKIEEMAAMVNTAESEERDFTPQEHETYNALEKDAESLRKRAERLAKAEGTTLDHYDNPRRHRGNLNADGAPAFIRRPGDPMSFLDGDGLRISDGLRAITNNGQYNGAVRELSDELARMKPEGVELNASGLLMPMAAFFGTRRTEGEIRNTVTSAPATGGGLMFTDHRGEELIYRLRENLDVGRLGATIYANVDGEKIVVPRIKSSSTLQWVAEGAALNETDTVFDGLTLAFKTAGVLCNVTRKVVMTSDPQVDTALRADFGEILRAGMDRAAVSGPGTGNQPKGILGNFPANTGDVQYGEIHPVVGGTNGKAPDWALMNKFRELVESSNGIQRPENSGWLLTAKLARKLRTTARVTGTDSEMIMNPDQNAAEGMEYLIGYPALSSRASSSLDDGLTKGTANSTASSCVFGDFSALSMAMWGAIEFMADPITGFAKGDVRFRALMHMDVGLKQAKSFAGSKDLLAA